MLAALGLFQWFDANCAWIYKNTNIFTWMFTDVEMEVPLVILKCLIMAIWYMVIITAPLAIVLLGIGYIIGSWTGNLPSFFVDKD